MIDCKALAALLFLFVSALPAPAAESAATVPLPRAHAHNDYLHPHPLTDALGFGFCSVEADIHLVDGELLVAHDLREVRPERTLQALYLDPLRERVRSNNGWVFGEGQTLTLLVDIKSEGEPTYDALRTVLADYRDMLSHVKDGQYHQRALDIVISGNRPIAEIAADAERYVFVDGRLDDLKGQSPQHFIPLVSDNWSKVFTWKGEGPMPEAERARLHEIVRQAHDQGRRLRFWATADKPACWTELADAGVDLIGTDDLAGLHRFLVRRRSE